HPTRICRAEPGIAQCVNYEASYQNVSSPKSIARSSRWNRRERGYGVVKRIRKNCPCATLSQLLRAQDEKSVSRIRNTKYRRDHEQSFEFRSGSAKGKPHLCLSTHFVGGGFTNCENQYRR